MRRHRGHAAPPVTCSARRTAADLANADTDMPDAFAARSINFFSARVHRTAMNSVRRRFSDLDISWPP
jgi:hypothetical protein